MIEVEQQLRHEMRTAAERIKPESVRPLRVPPPRRQSRTVRWLAPVAAAAAVAGLIAGLTVAGHSTSPRPGSQTVQAGMPKYYVTVSTPPRKGVLAVVRASATGAPISSVRLSQSQPRVPDEWDFGMIGAANDRAFLIVNRNSFEILRIAADGHVLRLTRLPEKVWDLSGGFGEIGDVLLSPDGREVVMPLADPTNPSTGRECDSCHVNGIGMYSVATGVIKKWLVPKSQEGVVTPVNWPGYGHEVLVNGSLAGYRLLNVAGPGGGLLANSRSVHHYRTPHGWFSTGPSLLPGGKYLIVEYARDPLGGPTYTGRILEISTRTGRSGRVLYAFSHVRGGLGCTPGALGPSGINALMFCGNRFGRLDGSHFTPLPGLSRTLPAAAW